MVRREQGLAEAALTNTDDLTARQGEVLDAALGYLVIAGAKLTMAGVARHASCSKETLYKWFGDRDGLLTAIVQWQAARVRAPVHSGAEMTAASLGDSLEQFGRDLLTVFTSDSSLALNRLGISAGGEAQPNLGEIVLENGRRAMGRRLKPVLEAAQAAGLLQFDDSEDAFRTFFGLVVRDVHIRALLGEDLGLSAGRIDAEAKRAREQFLALYGAKERTT